ncbi:PAS domain-containing protein [Streptomyces sp. L2]|uniref:hybrid sensor histidine kinase/response regulator n=1 Tax=Streptomyces sp. L2 TaxID=2162665 RepID=UPI001012026A|nr:PAS domain-containing protein [Streptomyces sp. L2]
MSSRPSRGAARLAAILDALPDALVLVNANGTVVNANTIALEAFEAPGTALVGRGLLDLLPQFDSKLIPGSMRLPDHMDPRGRTKPTRMIARRTDGAEFPVEVTSANLENGQQAYDGYGYTGDELLMLVVRDLSGTVDTEAELARSQRQTEMILRAAAEGVVGTDTDGQVVLVNPAAAQILGYRAGELGGKELHALVLHSRADGTPFPYEESPLADTLRSGRKHRVRGQVLWSKGGEKVSVDLTTAPVRDGDQLVGAVMTFTDRRPYDSLAEEKAALERAHAEELERLSEEHAADLTALRQEHVTETEELREKHEEELAAGEERYAALGEREKDRYEALAGRHEQLLTLLGQSLRGPLDELRRELAALAADDAGQLWPEANQVLHHLSAGYSRITTLIDNVLGYQRLDTGAEDITRTKVMLDAVVTAGVDGAVELIGPGRIQFAVHAPPIEAEVDPGRLATALAHLVADVAGVDATGNAPVSTGGYMDNTVVVAAAQRGEVVRIEVRGPYAGGDPVHEPIVRGIVRAHGGVLQTHEVPGMSGSAYVLEVPIGGGAGAVAGQPSSGDTGAAPDDHTSGSGAGSVSGGRRRARRASTDAFLEIEGAAGGSGEPGAGADAPAPTGRRRRRVAEAAAAAGEQGAPVADESAEGGPSSGTGRRRGHTAEIESGDGGSPGGDAVAEGAVVTAAEYAAGAAAVGTGLGAAVPPQGVPVPNGRRARHGSGAPQAALPPALPAAPGGTGAEQTPGSGAEPGPAEGAQPTGRRRRALAAAAERAAAQEAGAGAGQGAESGARTVFALPPAEADRSPQSVSSAAAPAVAQGPGAVALAPGAAPVSGAGTAAVPGQQTQATAAQPLVPGQAQAHGHAPVPGQVQAHGHAPVPGQVQLPGQAQAPAGPFGAGVSASGPASAPASGPASAPVSGDAARHDAVPLDQSADHTPPQPHPTSAPTGRRRRAVAQPAPAATGAPTPGPAAPGQGTPARGTAAQGIPVQSAPLTPAQAQAQAQGTNGQALPPAQPIPAQAPPGHPTPAAGTPAAQSLPAEAGQAAPPAGSTPAAGTGTGTPGGTPLPPEHATARPPAGQPSPADGTTTGTGTTTAADPNSTQGRAISVRTLGQGVPFSRQAAQVQLPTATPPPHAPGGSGRRRKLGTPPDPAARPEPQEQAQGEQAAARPAPPAQAAAQASLAGQSRLAPVTEGAGRSYAIGAPDADAAEGPEPLDGPGGAVEVADTPRPQPMDDELPPEPLDNPRRLLVWPAPDVTTQQALSDRGYRPVIVHSREEVDAQIAAFPAALFVDPLTGPITRTALQSLRQAAVAAEVPVLVTAGLGQATREAAYGADPAVLLKALAPRDSEQHPPRVLLIEEHAEIALALTSTLERRGMQVARAANDNDAVTLAGQFRPNLVVMDLMRVHRRQAGILDWLRANGQLNRTPLVVYTAAVDQADLPRLASGETVLFLAERSTSPEVQDRIVDLLARVGTN